MVYIRFLVLITSFIVGSLADYNDTSDDFAAGPKPLRDRFRLVQSNVDEQKLQDEIQDFLAYGCEKMVVVRNEAQESLKISCSSHQESPKAAVIKPDSSYVFTFKPRRSGNTVFWCNVEYKQMFARFDVYNEDVSYMCPRDIDEIYQYIVHHDGVYVVKKGDHGQKIRSLFKGHNKFILWEEFVNNETDGYLTSGLVDGGMCYDIPEQFNDKTAAVTVCYNQCVYLYEHYGCQGKIQVLNANQNCVDTGLSEELRGKLSAIRGC